MSNNMHSSPKDRREEKHKFLLDISDKEKQLVMLIHTKGLLHTDARELYRKVRFGYEKIIMYDNEQSEIQDLEYCLWKLHYKHIDEFRKRIKCTTSSTRLVDQQNCNQIEGFKRFLSEATEFYQSLIAKIRKYYSLPDESSFYRRRDAASFPEPKRIKQCHFLCHRFLVCLGDLARYREQYEKPDAESHNWSMAATYYMEATAIWPDSGNPQNQLAVLATYVGDEFLALYHCMRSLAVKEPFPDARDNLIVLLERNRSSFQQPRSTEARFNFLKPSERCVATTNLKSSDSTTSSVETDVWSLFIRLMSFFFIKSSFDDFMSVFSLIMRELDSLMALDDTALKSSLESYRKMDSVKTGPFRALQVVSILLYTLENSITNTHQVKDCEDTNDTQWALLATFIFMGRFVDRCLKTTAPDSCPLLPAALVFVEWLASRIDHIDKYHDEKNRLAMSYFFGSFVGLVNRFGAENASERAPLWEDYELRGFIPVAHSHELLDFSSHWECIDSFEKGIHCRAHRIVNAGRIIFDESGQKFMNHYTPKLDEPILSSKLHMSAAKSKLSVNGHSFTLEDEEVILFSPMSRHNELNPTLKEPEDPNTPPEDAYRGDTTLQNKPHHQELVFQTASPPISAGHPSLSSWVINGDNFVVPKEQTQTLSPIAESLYGLTITENNSSPVYEVPVPSAPLLPENATVQPDALSNLPPQLQPVSWTPVPEYALGPTLTPTNLLPQRQMTSSEWLRHYLQTHQTPLAPLPWPLPAYYYPSSTTQAETPLPPLYTVLPVEYGSEVQRRAKLVYGSYPYVCGGAVATDVLLGEPQVQVQPQPLLQYLKERERQLQGYDTLLGGPTPAYMGN